LLERHEVVRAVAVRQAAHCHLEPPRGLISARMELDIQPPT
jgi:hypothetical protein